MDTLRQMTRAASIANEVANTGSKNTSKIMAAMLEELSVAMQWIETFITDPNPELTPSDRLEKIQKYIDESGVNILKLYTEIGK